MPNKRSNIMPNKRNTAAPSLRPYGSALLPYAPQPRQRVVGITIILSIGKERRFGIRIGIAMGMHVGL